MSKDITRKGEARPNSPTNAKPSGVKAPASKAPAGKPQPPAARTSGATPRPGTPPKAGMTRSGPGSAQQQPQRRMSGPPQQPQKAGSNFGSRDVTLLIAGVMVVVFVVIGVLIFTSKGSSNNANTSAGTPTTGASDNPTPNVILEPSMKATLTASSANPDVQAAQTALASHQNITPVPTGQVAPDFTYPADDGKTYTLSSFRGKKPLLLEFMAPWCPHCQKDSTILNQVYDLYKDKNLQMLGISAHPYGRDWEDKQGNPLTSTPISMDDLNWFRDTYHVPYPLLLDKLVKSADDYGIAFFPTIYILDIDGKVTSQIQAETANPITVQRIQGELDKVVK